MVWSYDDNHIYTGGIDGAVYEWELKGLKRLRESVIKGCLYSSISCVKDVKNFFAVGSDRKLKELDDSIVVKVSRLRLLCLLWACLSVIACYVGTPALNIHHIT